MFKYGVIVYWSDEDETFIAEVPELPGCAGHGDTHEAALSSALDAIGLRLDTAKEFGDPIPKKLRVAELRKQIALGSEQADRGEFVDGEETFAEIRRRSAERKRPRG
jgi:predicted RNase H-like HicB family nuclease